MAKSSPMHVTPLAAHTYPPTRIHGANRILPSMQTCGHSRWLDSPKISSKIPQRFREDSATIPRSVLVSITIADALPAVYQKDESIKRPRASLTLISSASAAESVSRTLPQPPGACQT